MIPIFESIKKGTRNAWCNNTNRHTCFCYHYVNKREIFMRRNTTQQCIEKKSAYSFQLLFNFDWPETVNCKLAFASFSHSGCWRPKKRRKCVFFSLKAVKIKLTGCLSAFNYWSTTSTACRTLKKINLIDSDEKLLTLLRLIAFFLTSAFVLYFQNSGCKWKATTAFTIVLVYLHAFRRASIFQRSQIVCQKRKSVGSQIIRTEVISISLYTWRLQTLRTQLSWKWDRMACQSVSY